MRRQLSIFGTLVLLFTLTGFLIIGGVSLYLLRTFQRYQAREQRNALISKLLEVHSELQTVASAGEPLAEELVEIRRGIESENAHRKRSQFAVTIRRGADELLRVGAFPTAVRFPPPARTVESIVVEPNEAKDGRHYLVTSLDAKAGRDRVTVEIALDQTRNEEALDEFRESASVALFAGAALLALCGALVARRAMLPIARITEATRNLDMATPPDEIDAHSWPAELRALANAFAAMQRRLRDSFLRLSQFSADLAHELRTPVNNLLGEAEVTLGRPRSPEEYRRTIESMLEEVQRLRRMIDALLFLARAQHPERSIDLTTVDARGEAQAVAEFFSELAEEKGIAISIEGEANLRADRTLLRRALSNLVGNALHYADRGATIAIRLRAGKERTSIEVSDTGAGIEPRHLPHLFDRFYRVDEARSKHPEGTGLGLAIVQSIALLHGGTVSVSSTPGKGTTFVLQFPAET